MALDAQTLYGFVGSVLAHRFDGTVATPKAHLEWWDLCCSKDPFVAIAAPRGHAKSTAITHCYTLASVLFRDREFVLLVSDTYGQAVMFLQDIRSELADNELIHELFGRPTFAKDTESDIIVHMPDGHKFRIMAVGSEQKVRGIKWEHKRPDLIVGDDLENDEIVMNPERRDKFRNWIYKALLPCRSAHGIVRVIGTILHMDSFLENCMPKTWMKQDYHDDGIKVWATRTSAGWRAVKYRAHPRLGDHSKILWPDRWPREKLLAEYTKYVEAGHPEGYAQEYLNNPIDETRAFFRRSELAEMPKETLDDVKLRKKPLLYYMGCDLAISQEQRSDYSAFVVGGVDEEGLIYIIDVVRQRMDTKEIVDTILDLADRYQVEAIAIEEGVIKKSVGPFLFSEMANRGVSYYVVPGLVPSTDKPTRARGIQGRIRQGKVYFNKAEEWWPAFEDELISFPRAVHDDQVDALAWLGLILNRLSSAPTIKELEDEDFEEERRLTMQASGKSATTGY